MLFRSDRIFTIEYQSLINDTQPTIENMLAYCDLDWEEACLEFYKTKRWIKTASAGQVKQEIYQSALNRWELYLPMIQPLIEGLPEQ